MKALLLGGLLVMAAGVNAAETFECDAMSQLNRPSPVGPQSVLPVTFSFTKYGASEHNSNNGSETHYGEAEFDGIGYYHTSEDGRINLRLEINPSDNSPIVIAYTVGTDKATVWSHCKQTEWEE